MLKKNKTFYQRAKSWAATQKLIGHSSFSRFVMMTFVGRLNQITDEFVFKGGNLLWVYIKTPRATIDLEMVTRTTNDHEVDLPRLKRTPRKVETPIFLKGAPVCPAASWRYHCRASGLSTRRRRRQWVQLNSGRSASKIGKVGGCVLPPDLPHSYPGSQRN